MCHSPVIGKFYLFQNGSGELKQFELFDKGQGRWKVEKSGLFPLGQAARVKVSWQMIGRPAEVYVNEETEAIWKLGAEPEVGTARTQVDKPISQGDTFSRI